MKTPRRATLSPKGRRAVKPTLPSTPWGRLWGIGVKMVTAIFRNLVAGADIDDLMEWFDGLDRGQVNAVIELAARSLDKPPESAP